MNKSELSSFLKWPGGKRWLTPKFRQLFPSNYNRYFEPFLGGAAAFFFLNPSQAIISDVNCELINLYRVMRDNPIELANTLREHQNMHCKEYYYFLRSQNYDDSLQSASRLLYLNRTCYNGMYRVNKSGQFNVPIGTKQNCIFDIALFPEYSRRLRKAEIIACDFDNVISVADENDLVFCDPPYTIAHNQNSFIKYNEQLFTWNDQERLHESLCSARSRGAIVVATNANFNKLKSMYTDSGFFIEVVERFSSISGKVANRKNQEELLISSRPFDDFCGGEIG